jgi:hypothetical protein
MALLIRLLCFIAPVLIGLAASWPVHADETLQLHEQEIEAGLLYNFLKYVEWPDAARTGTMTVCIYGDDPFKGYLKPMEGRTVNQRRIDLRTVHDSSAAAGCDLLFVNAAEKGAWPQLEKSLAGKTVLTVSNLDDFAQSGGMIEFGRTDDHIRVSLNLDAVAAAKLKVEDRLLKLVTVVQNASGEGR